MTARFPFPQDPVGWYCLGRATALPPGQLRQVWLGGHDLVLFRTAGGRPGLVEATCPHMGAHFAHGGRVQGEELRCPFHDFGFDTDGGCVSTPYDQGTPRAARARSWPLAERDGLLFAWHHPDGLPPAWQLPEHECKGWLPLRMHRWELASHPQEISENSVDTGHFGAVHGYRDLQVLEPLRVDGPVLRTRYAFKRSALHFGLPGTLDFDIRIAVHGLGCSIVHTHVPRLDLRSRQYVLPTPGQAGRTTLRIAITTRRPERWSRMHPGLAVLPRPLVDRLVGLATIRIYAHEVAQDHHIWEHKAYLHPPALARGDGPVGRYRVWCRQFYPHADRTRASA